MTREGLSIASLGRRQPRATLAAAALVLAFGTAWAVVLALGTGAAWGQVPGGQPVGNSGIVPISPNNPNNPQNFNPTIGTPIAPTQPQAAGLLSNPAEDPAAGPTRKAYAPAFQAPGSMAAGAAASPGTAFSSAAKSPAARFQLPPLEKMKFEGAEIIAWVGSQPILAADVLFESNRMIEQAIAKSPGADVKPEDIAKARINYMRFNLKRLIETKLLFIEAAKNVPPEAIPKIEKQFYETFDKMYLRKMIEGEGCGSRGELDAKYRRQGTTVESMRRMAFEGSFAARWLEDHVKNDDEITHQDMLNYYNDHHADYEKPRRVRWEHLMARFDKFNSKAEAFGSIAQWGNEILGGASFADVAKAHSHDLTAEDGGVHPWTSDGSLRSQEVNKVLFELPVDTLSQIIEDSRGFHIVRVIERDDVTSRPFTDVQVEIRKKIRESRDTDRRAEYLDKLRAKTPVWTIFDELPEAQTAAGPRPGRR